jgi:hypothetical protein
MRIDELIADTRPLLAPSDDSRALQDAEMLRDVLLRRLEHRNQLMPARRLRGKALDEPDAERLAEDAQAFCDQVGSLTCQWTPNGPCGERGLPVALLSGD